MKLRHPLAHALNHGSSKDGVGHWWAQRLSAILLLALMAWFVYAIGAVAGADFESARAWLGRPVHAALGALFVLTGLYHASLGLQVVIEDYVHHRPTELVALVVIKLLAIVTAALVIFALFNISVGG